VWTCVQEWYGMTLESRELYRSSSGDRWQLAREPDSGRVFVVHEPNVASGGRMTHIEISAFLAAGRGPEHQELLRLIGSWLRSRQMPGADSSAHLMGRYSRSNSA
jgi:hypothetical protein